MNKLLLIVKEQGIVKIITEMKKQMEEITECGYCQEEVCETWECGECEKELCKECYKDADFIEESGVTACEECLMNCSKCEICDRFFESEYQMCKNCDKCFCTDCIEEQEDDILETCDGILCYECM